MLICTENCMQGASVQISALIASSPRGVRTPFFTSLAHSGMPDTTCFGFPAAYLAVVAIVLMPSSNQCAEAWSSHSVKDEVLGEGERTHFAPKTASRKSSFSSYFSSSPCCARVRPPRDPPERIAKGALKAAAACAAATKELRMPSTDVMPAYDSRGHRITSALQAPVCRLSHFTCNLLV